MFSVTSTSKSRGRRIRCMAAASTSMCSSGDVGELLAHHALRHLAPQPRGLEHVGLVDRGELAAPRARQAGRPRARCARSPPPCRCTGPMALSRIAALLAEVDAAGQLAHEHQVDALEHLALERRGVRAAPGARSRGAGWRRRRAPAQAQQALLGPHAWPAAPTTSGRRWRPAGWHRRCGRRRASRSGKRVAVSIDGRAAEGQRGRA